MARFKTTVDPRSRLVEDVDNASPATRRTTRRVKPKVETEDSPESDSSPDVEDEDEQEHEQETVDSSSLSPVPDAESGLEPEPVRKRRGRPPKNPAAKAPARLSVGESLSETPVPASRRSGGNKRKHDHEYCLTCSHYGRACGGRRDGIEGCAVCREPNRQKGEKMRECLWADPENGVGTYLQAREVLKRAQAAERAAQGKAPTKRQMQFLSEAEATQYLRAPDNLGIVQPPFPGPPPVRRPLNLLPPPSAVNTSRSNGTSHDKAASGSADENDTIVVNTPTDEAPRRPQVIKLYCKEAQANNVNGNHSSSAPPQSQKQDSPQPPTDDHGFRVPYYDPNMNAYVLPAYPYSNLLPPYMQDKVSNQSYISPYDAYPCIPIVISNVNPPQTVNYQARPPPPNANFTKPRPLDKTGQPVRKWSRSNSHVKNVGGYSLSTKGWTPNGNHKDGAETPQELRRGDSNAVSTETGTHQDDSDHEIEAGEDHNDGASSDLSSAMDVDVDMEDGGTETTEPSEDAEEGHDGVNGVTMSD
ncbi:hypothetical protein LTS08_008710 [Lithohypha guttulata]|uniref:uncharacterized protein n=1 Tax=Lithohypha guttulata TaxID=1690604 RepID=UPI002DE0753C|nr:hypothetical protein LTR51_008355 [Lithohypha guttulata]KAK5094219.1 hypothetical protein LTS08_008710 [Lithohypha guttulata]